LVVAAAFSARRLVLHDSVGFQRMSYLVRPVADYAKSPAYLVRCVAFRVERREVIVSRC